MALELGIAPTKHRPPEQYRTVLYSTVLGVGTNQVGYLVNRPPVQYRTVLYGTVLVAGAR